MTAFGKQRHFCLFGYDTNNTRLCLNLCSRLRANARSADRVFAPNVTNNTADFTFSFLFAKRLKPIVRASGVEKCYHSFPKDTILTNMWLQKCQRSDVVNPNTDSCGVCNLVTLKICSIYFSFHSKY